jgi:GNAT superfamily N-acetyltransferase
MVDSAEPSRVKTTFYVMPITISPATPADIPALLELIRELARFERLEYELETTADSLREALFGPNPAARALLARVHGTAAGYAIFFFTFSSFTGRRGVWLEDVFVQPPFRKRGVGSSLMKAVARVAAESNCARYEWTALNWNKNALDVYQKMGARTMDEWILLRMNRDAIHQLAASNAP